MRSCLQVSKRVALPYSARVQRENTGRSKLVAESLELHAEGLRRFVARRVPASAVDDVLQSAALRALGAAESLRQSERVLAWLFQIHRRTIADLFRVQFRDGAIREGLQVDLEPSSTPHELCDCSVVQASRLPKNQAEVIQLIDGGENTLEEAAEILGITKNNAAVRLHRARKALREAMLSHCGVTNAKECVDCRCVSDGCC